MSESTSGDGAAAQGATKFQEPEKVVPATVNGVMVPLIRSRLYTRENTTKEPTSPARAPLAGLRVTP